MCGFVCVIDRTPIDTTVIEAMAASLEHRGPDDFGYYHQPHFSFGHRRLSILDLSINGRQPMSYLNKYTLVFNGEIFNFQELKRILVENGYDFHSNTDTEVVMAAYDFWGEKCVQHFNGMWSFVIYDSSANSFFVSRDRFGIKPLYYYQSDSLLIFASEIKAILKYPSISRDLDTSYIQSLLCKGPMEHLKETIFTEIKRFDRASYAVLPCSFPLQELKETVFWSIEPNKDVEDFSPSKAREYASRYRILLRDAVRIRLRADVKVGSALSGGLDSSSIVYLVNDLLQKMGSKNQQETFSSIYPDTDPCLDESGFVNMLVKELGVVSHVIEPKVEDIPSQHRQMMIIMETPPNSTCMSGWHTFKLAKASGVFVTLDGQGADEQLAGYLHYFKTHLLALRGIEFYREFLGALRVPGLKRTLIKVLCAHCFRIVLGDRRSKRYLEIFFGFKHFASLNEHMQKDFSESLMNLLHYSDRVSMGHGVESRMPFLDYRLVEFLASVPSCYKIHRGWSKYIARLAFDGRLPSEIVWRKDKVGWSIPEKLWFSGPLAEWLKQTVNNSQLLRGCCSHLLSARNFKSLSLTKQVRLLNLAVFDEIFAPEVENLKEENEGQVVPIPGALYDTIDT
jgi:asparagine synthase (glutamine-hydrolysing)